MEAKYYSKHPLNDKDKNLETIQILQLSTLLQVRERLSDAITQLMNNSIKESPLQLELEVHNSVVLGNKFSYRHLYGLLTIATPPTLPHPRPQPQQRDFKLEGLVTVIVKDTHCF